MKKLIIILFLFVSVCLFASTTYTVDTTHGPQEVVIPDGYSELDVLLILAQNYYNLSYEHDELLEKAEHLTQTVDKYITEFNKLQDQYKKVIADYKDLVAKYKELSQVKPLKGLIGGAVEMTATNKFTFNTVSVLAGVTLFEKVHLFTILGYSIANNAFVPGLGAMLSF